MTKEATPISALWIKPSKSKARTPLNGVQIIHDSKIKFQDLSLGKQFGLITQPKKKAKNLDFTKNIQTLDFRSIEVPSYLDDDTTKELLTREFIGAPTFLSKNNKWTNKDFDNSKIARGALDAHFGADKTLDYYYQNFNRNSVDNKGMILLNGIAPKTIDADGSTEDGHNAFWAGSFNYKGKKYGMMGYLDGVTRDKRFKKTGDVGLVAGIDVLGHEVTHGVTENTAGLIYEGEPGALNEGFSDIFGTNVKAFTLGVNESLQPNWSWMMGGTWWPVRNMANPNHKKHPDTYKGKFWDSSIDDGGVHTNSGVLNYWYVLGVEGSGNNGPGKEHPDLLIGSQENYTNDNGFVYDVTGIGLSKMQGVAYHALTNYLQPDSDFIDARMATIKAAEDLTNPSIAQLYPGVPQLTNADVSSVIAAWDAVGVGGGLAPALPLI